MRKYRINQLEFLNSDFKPSKKINYYEVDLKTETVLVLNRSWQAIGVKNIAESLSMMYSGNATGLNIIGNDEMTPTKWVDWINLPFDVNSKYVKTVRGEIKAPKVIVLARYNQVPKRRPTFTSKNIWSRDRGICQYTGQKLAPEEANIDHVVPKSRGGMTTWNNCVLTHKEVNSYKGNRTPDEAGLKLLKQPTEPKYLPVTFFIRNRFNIPEWDIFLKYEN